LTERQLNSVFLLMTFNAWGQWVRIAEVLSSFSPALVREICYGVLGSALASASTETAFPILDRLVSDFSPSQLWSVSFLPPSLIVARLQRIESLACTSVIVSQSSDPLVDLPVVFSERHLPTREWSVTDDRRLIWAVWQQGRPAFSLDES
jgi:hypothetical protein